MEPLRAGGRKVENSKSVQVEMEAASYWQDISMSSLVLSLKTTQILRFSFFLFPALSFSLRHK